MRNQLKVPEKWKEATKKAKGSKISLIIGETDTGKSTLVKFLQSKLGGSIIDSDVGQSDIGPPAVIGLSKNGKRLSDGYFVGSTTPSGHFLEMVVGTKRMAERADFPAFIDTTGMVHGSPARTLKTQKIESLQPDLIFLLGDNLDYYHTFENVGIDVVGLPISKGVRSRSRKERKNSRRKAFQKYFSNSEKKTVNLSEIGLVRTILGNGRDVTKEVSEMVGAQIHRSEKSSGSLFLVTNKKIRSKIQEKMKKTFHVKGIESTKPSNFKSLLVGLVGKENNFLGVGILENLNFDSFQATVLMPRDTIERTASIQFGSMKVRRDGKELGFVSIP